MGTVKFPVWVEGIKAKGLRVQVGRLYQSKVRLRVLSAGLGREVIEVAQWLKEEKARVGKLEKEVEELREPKPFKCKRCGKELLGVCGACHLQEGVDERVNALDRKLEVLRKRLNKHTGY